ncbi:MAG: prolipoprotein diacylglyceryl transferase [Fidelibacterota bacterium]
MIPVLFKIGPLPIHSYGLMLVVAFLTDYYLLKYLLKERGMKKDERTRLAGDVVLWAAIGGIVGSRIYYLVENSQRFFEDPIGMIFSGAGLVFFGGLMGGTIAVSILVTKSGFKWLEFADIVAPLIIMGYAIGRIGCLLVGDDYGTPSDLPWALTFPIGTPPTQIPVHPTQIYETLLGFGIFTLLWKLRGKLRPNGSLFSLYLVLAGLERFFIEFIRTNPKYLFGLSGAQIISILMILLGTIMIVSLRQAVSEKASLESSS